MCGSASAGTFSHEFVGTDARTVRGARSEAGRRTSRDDQPAAIIVVEYPSPAAFLDMVSNEEYLKVHEHRAAGLDRGDLIATSIWTMAE
jgi:hypothetical protein